MFLQFLNFWGQYSSYVYLFLAFSFYFLYFKEQERLALVFAFSLVAIALSSVTVIPAIEIPRGSCLISERSTYPYPTGYDKHIRNELDRNKTILNFAKAANAENIKELEEKYNKTVEELNKYISFMEDYIKNPTYLYAVLDGKDRPLVVISEDKTVQTLNYQMSKIKFVECSPKMTTVYQKAKDQQIKIVKSSNRTAIHLNE